MELIKKIRQAETQAQQIIEKAKVYAVEQAEKEKQKRAEATVTAEQNRKKTIDSAISKALQQGTSQVELLKQQAEKDRQKLQNEVQAKTANAISSVVNYLKG